MVFKISSYQTPSFRTWWHIRKLIFSSNHPLGHGPDSLKFFSVSWKFIQLCTNSACIECGSLW